MNIKVDEEVMTEEEFQKKLCFSSWGGQASSWEEATSWLLHKSGEAFVAKKNEDALLLRNLAGEAKQIAHERRKKQQEFK